MGEANDLQAQSEPTSDPQRTTAGQCHCLGEAWQEPRDLIV